MEDRTDSSDLLTVDERFFLHIAQKNGLLDAAQTERAMETCRERDLSLEDAIRALGLLDDARILKVREAMAASQVVRLDSVYADVAVQNGLVARALVDQAFAEQRRQRYRVRIGNLMVERRVLTEEQHRSVITEVIRRLRQLGPEAYGSTIERRGAQAERSALGSAIGADPASASARVAAPASTPPGVAAPPGFDRTREMPAPLPREPFTPAAARGWNEPSGIDNSAVETKTGGPEAADPLVESAIRIGLSSESGELFPFHRSDEAAAERQLRESSAGEPPKSASFVLDRVELSSGEAFETEEYLRRRRRRQRLLVLGGGTAGAALLALLVSLALAIFANREALDDVRGLLSEATSLRDPESKRRAYLRASERLSAVGALGVGEETRAELRDRVRWGALHADALALLGGGKPDEARQLLERRRGEVPQLARGEYEALLREAAREHALTLARAAEARKDWAAAVAAFRDAQEQGDPGGVAATRLAAIRADLVERLGALEAKALGSLAEDDEAALTRAAKQITELFNEDPGISERLDEVQYRRALSRGEEHLRKDELEAAHRELQRAKQLRPKLKEVEPLLALVEARRGLAAELRQAQAAEAGARWAQAVEFYQRALAFASREDERRTLEQAIARCETQARQDEERRRRAAVLDEAVGHLRSSRIAEARRALEGLAAGRSDATATKLLELTKRLDDMVYVPAGAFLMGTPPGSGVRPAETPQRKVEVAAYFIDRTEVTNAEYAAFVATAAVPPPSHWTAPVRQPDGSVRLSYEPSLANHPVVNVTWTQARAFAKWRGGRLPSEAQWEKAARGADGRTFPWGEGTQVSAHVQVPPDRLRGHPTAPVGGFKDDTSPWGVQDMAGNVGEWTDDPFGPYPGAPADLEWPPGRRAIRGGAYRWRFEDARCAARDRGEEDGYVSPTVGFRVVVEVPADLPQLR